MKTTDGDDKPAREETVRTNIIMETPLVEEAQKITGIKTKAGVVHYALREVVRRARQKEVLKWRGKVEYFPSQGKDSRKG